MISFLLGSERVKKARTKAIVMGAISLSGSTGVNLVVGVVLAGLLARYFSTDEFGLWSILMSLNGIMIIGFDLGFGNALRNKLAQIYTHKEGVDRQGPVYFFSVFYWFIFSAGILALLFFLMKPFIPWGLLFRSGEPEIIANGSSLMTIGASVLAVNIAFNLYSSGFFGYQESHWNAFLNGLSRLALLLGILSLVLLKSSFFIINLMFFMITLLLSMVSFFIFLRKRRWKFRLLRLTFLIGAVKELWRQSAQFALLQIFSTFLLNADYFVISKMVGLEIVGEYFLVKRIYLVVVAFHFALLLPVWSAYTESVESKDFVWVEMPRKTTSNAIMMPLMGIGIMLFVGNWVVPVDWKNDSFLFPLCMVGGLWIDLWVEQLFFGFSERNREFETTDFFVEICTVTFVPSALFWAERYRLLGICMALITVHLPVAVLNPLESLGIFTRFSKVGVVRQN